MSRNFPRRRSNRRHRRGQSLAEFAVVSLVLFALLAAILEFGRALFVSQQLQTIVDVAAREFATAAFPADLTFDEARDDDNGNVLYSEDFLVITDDQVDDLPPVNRLLLPLMFYDDIGGERYRRYPGAIVTSDTAASGFTIQVPIVDSGGSITWSRVIEEIQFQDGSASYAPFAVTGAVRQEGLVALQINYPYQASTMISYVPTGGGYQPVAADDGALVDTTGPLGGAALVSPDAPVDGDLHRRTYSGEYGLGAHYALASEYRPFRKVLSARAIYRREVFATATESASSP